MIAGRYRKRPIVVDVLQWTGDNVDAMVDFCGLGRDGHPNCMDYDGAYIEVWNSEEEQFIRVPEGHVVIRGVKGEVYPCSLEVFEATYEDEPTAGGA